MINFFYAILSKNVMIFRREQKRIIITDVSKLFHFIFYFSGGEVT